MCNRNYKTVFDFGGTIEVGSLRKLKWRVFRGMGVICETLLCYFGRIKLVCFVRNDLWLLVKMVRKNQCV